MLPTDPKERKATPIYSGFVKYFPLAMAEVSRVSLAGNIQHNGPDADLEWDKSKSSDHLDCVQRHLIQAGTIDTDKQRHTAKMAWRAMAALEMELESGLVVHSQQKWVCPSCLGVNGTHFRSCDLP